MLSPGKIRRPDLQEAQLNGWHEITVPRLTEITRDQVVSMFQGEVAAIRAPEFFTPEQCAAVVTKIRQQTAAKARRYKGNLNIQTDLDISSHWEFEYRIEDDKAWVDYFKQVEPTTRLRKELFSEIGDPVERIVKILRKVWGAPVKRARHPEFNKQLYVGLLRTGAPKLHFDWAPYDMPSLKDVVMQAGANVYLSNYQVGGDLTIYRRYGISKGNKQSSGEQVVGNYDLPHELVEGVEECTVHCGVGDFVIAPNRFLHEVTPGNSAEENRLVLSFHVAWMGDGSLAVFS
jgi:hypothetical protein